MVTGIERRFPKHYTNQINKGQRAGPWRPEPAQLFVYTSTLRAAFLTAHNHRCPRETDQAELNKMDEARGGGGGGGTVPPVPCSCRIRRCAIPRLVTLSRPGNALTDPVSERADVRVNDRLELPASDSCRNL